MKERTIYVSGNIILNVIPESCDKCTIKNSCASLAGIEKSRPLGKDCSIEKWDFKELTITHK